MHIRVVVDDVMLEQVHAFVYIECVLAGIEGVSLTYI